MEQIFDQRVQQQVERLSGCSLAEIERQVAQKRIDWCRQNMAPAKDAAPLTPRQAFEWLFFRYMGLAEDELPIARENAREIAWYSRNPCPTLAACTQLGQDTRRVCRAAYEKSTQAFISQLDPQLRFLRSYEEIRPYAGHCLEWIARVDFAQMMDLAVQEAWDGKEDGDPPGGAVMLLGKNILGMAHDTASDTPDDPGQHAEAHVIYQAVQTAGDSNLSGAILFTTREPCAACAALALRANLTTIVYGVTLEETASPGALQSQEGARAVIERSPVLLEMIGGVLAERCMALYR